jgi:DNA polymerase (family 10)
MNDRLPLDFALRCADRILKRLAPMALEIEVAGSIRRGLATVGDIDLVAIPKVEEVKDLFGGVQAVKNRLADEVRAWCAAEGWQLEKNGEQNMIWAATSKVSKTPIQVDLYMATPETWGTLLLCRTGSATHNIALCELAIARGGKWNPYAGLYLHGKKHSKTEEAIYGALGLPWLPPPDRTPAAIQQHQRRPAAAPV